MNYGKQENIRVKNQIVEGLFQLLNSTSFSKITVSELIEAAHVARASYYRNFDSKEDILDYYFEQLVRQRKTERATTDIWTVEFAKSGFTASFALFLREKEQITLLLNNGLSSYFYEMIYRYVIDLAGDMPANSPDRYRLNIFAGAIFSVLSEWLLSGAKESPQQMAALVIDYLHNGLFQS